LWRLPTVNLTFAEPLVCNKVDIKDQLTGYSVKGSPADCVKLACMQLAQKPIDLLVSGINNGVNTGINVFYSGTVAAAIEGAFLGIPAVAMSLFAEEYMDYEKAAAHGIDILQKLMPLKAGEVININIPKLSKGKPKGIKVVPQSAKGFNERYIRQKNRHGQTVFQLAGEPHNFETAKDDASSIDAGFITITALNPDMTNHKKTDELAQKNW